VKKIFIIAGCIVIAFVLIISLTYLDLYLYNAPPRQGQPEMEKEFQRDKELIFTARDYLTQLEYDEVAVYHYSNLESLYVSSERAFISIADDEEPVAIRRLLRDRGYRSIIKHENCIMFTRWGNLGDLRGVVYSIDGQTPDGSAWGSLNLSKLEPLSPEGWYYFETTERLNTRPFVLPPQEELMQRAIEFQQEQD